MYHNYGLFMSQGFVCIEFRNSLAVFVQTILVQSWQDSFVENFLSLILDRENAFVERLLRAVLSTDALNG